MFFGMFHPTPWYILIFVVEYVCRPAYHPPLSGNICHIQFVFCEIIWHKFNNEYNSVDTSEHLSCLLDVFYFRGCTVCQWRLQVIGLTSCVLTTVLNLRHFVEHSFGNLGHSPLRHHYHSQHECVLLHAEYQNIHSTRKIRFILHNLVLLFHFANEIFL